MKTFPMFLTTTGRRIVICGGGEQAAQKARLVMRTEAELVLAAPGLDAELAALVAQGRALHHAGPVTPDLFTGSALVFIATGCAGADAALHAIAKAAGALVNVVDRPELCDAITPSIVDRDPVVVAIGTEGTAPVLARQIKTAVEGMLEPRLGELAALAGRMRDAVARNFSGRARRDFWAWVFSGPVRAAHARGAEREAARLMKRAIEAGERSEAGSVALIGAGPGSADLITLRGIRRLQEADVVFYDRLVDPGLLELARRDAERVYVGKAPGAHSWPQERINGVIVAAARAGKRVVRLKCGDPGIFARGAEEAEAVRAAGLPLEIVPGVTAASGAAAAAGLFLTERGQTDTLVLATGQTCDGRETDWAAHARPGTTLAVYMGVSTAASIAGALIDAGCPGAAPVDIVASAQSPEERRHVATLATLADTVARENVASPAMLLIRWPAGMVREAALRSVA